jgi:cobalt/nickel transport protein
MARHGRVRGGWAVLVAALMVVMGPAAPGAAHFHVYWPQVEGCYGKVQEPVTWRYFWGHPYEMIVDDAPVPKFFMVTPQGTREPLTPRGITLRDGDSGKDRKAYAVEYKPAAPGDYYLCLEAPAVFIPEDRVFCEDFVKAPWHVVAEKGWDKEVKLPVEIVPLTRPYGWPAGSVFRGKALVKGKALTGATVEIEKFNGFYVAKDLVPRNRWGEENGPLLTRTVKTDRLGYFVCTLDSPGWWVIAVSAPGGRKMQNGKPYPVEMRGYLWVYMEPPPPPLAPPPQ